MLRCRVCACCKVRCPAIVGTFCTVYTKNRSTGFSIRALFVHYAYVYFRALSSLVRLGFLQINPQELGTQTLGSKVRSGPALPIHVRSTKTYQTVIVQWACRLVNHGRLSVNKISGLLRTVFTVINSVAMIIGCIIILLCRKLLSCPLHPPSTAPIN